MTKELKESLSDHLNDEEEERFVIDDDGKADWALRKIKEHQEKITEAVEFAEAEKHKIDQWVESIEKKHQRNIDRLQGLLAEYASMKRQEDPTQRTFSLPNGRFGFYKQRDRWIYDDEALLKSLKKSGLEELIRIKETPNKRDLRKNVEVIGDQIINPETGEVIEGVKVQEQGEKFDVRN